MAIESQYLDVLSGEIEKNLYIWRNREISV